MLPRSIEWPTVLVALVDVVGLIALIALGDRLPVGLALVLLALSAAWFNSVQHEIIHGHPTPWQRVNDTLGSLPFGVVFPFSRYRDTHLAHHRDELLTLPGVDPESFYVSATEWEAASRPRRWLLMSLQTLAGRMLLGPPVYALAFWRSQLVAARADRAVRRTMVVHTVRSGVFLALVWAAPISMWVYLLGAVWLGWSVSIVRSFAEHRAVASGSPTALVRGGPISALLFLNNNLHVTHHERPGLAWYRIPEAFAGSDHAERAAAGAGLYSSYVEVFRRHFVRPLWTPVHPGSAVSGGRPLDAWARPDRGGAMGTLDITVTAASGALGAVVEGIDLAAIDDDGVASLRGLLDEHLVLFFPRQQLDDDSQLAFALRFGEYYVHPLARVNGSVSPRCGHIVDDVDHPPFQDQWHTDVSWDPMPPTHGVLRMIDRPARGGDTLFANMYTAFDRLSTSMQEFLSGLTARHTMGLGTAFRTKSGDSTTDQARELVPGAERPVVGVHPRTGRRYLDVNAAFTESIVELSGAESRAVLALLFAHISSPNFQVRWVWSPGDVVVWDERPTQHFAVADHYPQRREVARVNVIEPIG